MSERPDTVPLREFIAELMEAAKIATGSLTDRDLDNPMADVDRQTEASLTMKLLEYIIGHNPLWEKEQVTLKLLQTEMQTTDALAKTLMAIHRRLVNLLDMSKSKNDMIREIERLLDTGFVDLGDGPGRYAAKRAVEDKMVLGDQYRQEYAATLEDGSRYVVPRGPGIVRDMLRAWANAKTAEAIKYRLDTKARTENFVHQSDIAASRMIPKEDWDRMTDGQRSGQPKQPIQLPEPDGAMLKDIQPTQPAGLYLDMSRYLRGPYQPPADELGQRVEDTLQQRLESGRVTVPAGHQFVSLPPGWAYDPVNTSAKMTVDELNKKLLRYSATASQQILRPGLFVVWKQDSPQMARQYFTGCADNDLTYTFTLPDARVLVLRELSDVVRLVTSKVASGAVVQAAILELVDGHLVNRDLPNNLKKSSSREDHRELASGLGKVFTLATSHLPKSSPDFGPLRWTSHDHGWLVFVNQQTELAQLPEWMWPIYEAALKQGCELINFDDGGDDFDSFVKYDW